MNYTLSILCSIYTISNYYADKARLFFKKYGLILNVIIQTKNKKHIHDFDYRFGICARALRCPPQRLLQLSVFSVPLLPNQKSAFDSHTFPVRKMIRSPINLLDVV